VWRSQARRGRAQRVATEQVWRSQARRGRAQRVATEQPGVENLSVAAVSVRKNSTEADREDRFDDKQDWDAEQD
jgi:hypothetical protein